MTSHYVVSEQARTLALRSTPNTPSEACITRSGGARNAGRSPTEGLQGLKLALTSPLTLARNLLTRRERLPLVRLPQPVSPQSICSRRAGTTRYAEAFN